MKTWKSKSNQNYTVIKDAPTAIIEFARSKPRYAKIQDNGLIVMHNQYFIECESLAKKTDVDNSIIAEVSSIEKMHKEASKLNDSNALSDIEMHWRVKEFNHAFSGKTVAEANEMIKSNEISMIHSESRSATFAK